jgi:hypothetical protein
MTEQLPTRAQCHAAARAALDRARVEAAADYAAGRMTGDRLAAYERVRAQAAARDLQRAAATDGGTA